LLGSKATVGKKNTRERVPVPTELELGCPTIKGIDLAVCGIDAHGESGRCLDELRDRFQVRSRDELDLYGFFKKTVAFLLDVLGIPSLLARFKTFFFRSKFLQGLRTPSVFGLELGLTLGLPLFVFRLKCGIGKASLGTRNGMNHRR
jgi:hypothetical protein